MSLYKRKNGVFYIDLFIGGKRVRQSTGTTDAKKARELHDKIANERWKVQKLGGKKERLWMEAVVKYLQESTHKRSLHDDITHLDFIKQYWDKFYLYEITQDAIDELKKKRFETKVSTTTVNLMLSVIRIILRKARYEWNWMHDIPLIKLIPNDNHRMRWLTKEEAQSLLDNLKQPLRDMAAFTLVTGLRASNVSFLRWNQVCLINRHAYINSSESKSKKALPVPLNQAAISIIKRQPKINDYVFNSVNGKPMQQLSVRAFKNALKKAGISNFRWHDLRHTWASWHVQNGTSLQELQQLGGWSSFEMVLRYAHLSSNHLKNAADRVNVTFMAHNELRLVENVG